MPAFDLSKIKLDSGPLDCLSEKWLDEFAAGINAMLAKGLGSWEARFVSRRALDPEGRLFFFASTHRPIDCLYIITVHSLIANP